MAKFKLIKLRPKGPFTGIPHADTLFGAISNALGMLYDGKTIEEFVKFFQSEEALISSAFPYSKKELLLPKPLTVELALRTLFPDYAMRKSVKKAKYLAISEFEKAIRLEPFEVIENLPYKTVDLPKVILDRVTQSSSIYYWEQVAFGENSGLFFLYSGREEVFRDYIKPAMKLLGDTGIGGKSTWGLGLFEPEFGEIEIKTPKSEYFVTLSNAVPNKKPMMWNLLRKGGWSMGKRKPKITFIAEGSIVKKDDGKILSFDMGLGHPVYIYGKVFPIAVRVPEGLG
ncbi:type III-A CRISPR-associated RAMP protein Csm4 [Palaeococcus sp. (in: euryarchaeotes)]